MCKGEITTHVNIPPTV